MNKEKTTSICLELLLLNDLFRTNAIDKDIYDLAMQKIVALKKPDHNGSQPMIPAIA